MDGNESNIWNQSKEQLVYNDSTTRAKFCSNTQLSNKSIQKKTNHISQ